MKKKIVSSTIAFSLFFGGVASMSAFASTGEPVESKKLTEAYESEEVTPQFLPAYAAIAAGARVAAGGVKAAKWAGAAFGAGFMGAAGADAYSKAKSGKSVDITSLPEDSEVAFD